MPTNRRISRRYILFLSAWMCWAVVPVSASPTGPRPPEADRFPEQRPIQPESLQDGHSLSDKFFIMKIINIFERQTSAKLGYTSVPQFSRDYIFEGDIVLDTTQAINLILKTSSAHHRRKRKVDVSALLPTSATTSKRWTLPINYVFHDKFPEPHQTAVKEGVALWEQNTCIRFTHDATSDNKSLVFIDDNVCYSYVGNNQNSKQQIISIGDTCLRIGHVVHEIGHALGFWHEHARNDREEHVNILWNHIKLGQSHNFANQSWGVINNMGVPYDVGSVMHYSGKTFAKGVAATLESLDPMLQNTMGQRQQLSFYDAKLANMAYCNTTCAGFPLNGSCMNDGYQDPNNCSRCKCPDGLAGDFCDTVAPSIGQCGGTINLSRDSIVTIMSPGYPVSFTKDLKCYWLIKSPNGTSIHLEFQEPFMGSGFCDPSQPFQQCEDFVEIRATGNLALTGGRFCCDDEVQRAKLKIPVISNSSHALVLFQTIEEGQVGFKLSLSVASCGGCYSNFKEAEKPCSRSVVRDCVQTWYMKEELSGCAIMTWGCNTQYITKAVHRNTKCYSEESYCCHGYQLSSNKDICERFQNESTTVVSTSTTSAPMVSTTVTPAPSSSVSHPNSSNTSHVNTSSSSTASSHLVSTGIMTTTASSSTTDVTTSTSSSTTTSNPSIIRYTYPTSKPSSSSSSTYNKSGDESDGSSRNTWYEWSQWGDCSVSCGGCGTRERSRTCGKGQGCIGDSSESQACGSTPCSSGVVTICGETSVQSFGCGLFGLSTCYRTIVQYKTQIRCCCGFAEVEGVCIKSSR